MFASKVQEEIDLWNSEKHNEPNPILAVVRNDQMTGGPSYDDALREVTAGEFDGMDSPDPAHLAHARLVLGRLVRLSS